MDDKFLNTTGTIVIEEFQQARNWVKANIVGRKPDLSRVNKLPLEELKYKAARYDAIIAGLFPLPQEDEEEEDDNSDQE